MGASDYILKTTRQRYFSRDCVCICASILLRQAPDPPPSTLTPHKTISFGSLTIDPVNRRCCWRRKRRPVDRRFRSAVGLATHAGQIMDRDALLKNLRGVTYDGMDRSVDVAISRLRKTARQRHGALSY